MFGLSKPPKSTDKILEALIEIVDALHANPKACARVEDFPVRDPIVRAECLLVALERGLTTGEA